MRICQVSKADSFGGGASRSTEQLTLQLLKDGHHADHLMSWSGKGYRDHFIGLYGRYEKKIRSAHAFVKKIGFPELIPFELPIFLRRGRISSYDIFHFHDLSSAISPLTLLFLSRFKPVVWTFHDCSPFTGGCLYPMDCRNYFNGCGNCPQIGEWPIDTKYDFTRLLRLIKSLVQRGGVIPTAPSEWMADRAMESGIMKIRPIVINNGIDISTYKPWDKKSVRRELGLPENRLTILVAAGSMSDSRKGGRYAVEVINRIRDLNPFVVLLGGVDQAFLELLQGVDVHPAGYISDQNHLSKWYSCADLQLFCSMADNQPLSIIEAQCSGTPIFGFQTGGVPEQVLDGVCGALVPQRDIDGLANRVREAVSAGVLPKWAAVARERASTHFTMERVSRDYIKLYETAIEARASGVPFPQQYQVA